MFYFYTIWVTYGYLLRLTFISYQNFAKGFPRSLALIPLGNFFSFTVFDLLRGRLVA